MGIWQRFSTNLDLMGRMFNKTDAVNGVAFSGDMEMSMRQAVFRCAGCKSIEDCRHWLDTAAEHSAPPSFCANAALIERLREAA